MFVHSAVTRKDIWERVSWIDEVTAPATRMSVELKSVAFSPQLVFLHRLALSLARRGKRSLQTLRKQLRGALGM